MEGEVTHNVEEGMTFDDIGQKLMTKPCTRRFFRKVGATIQSSFAIDEARDFMVGVIMHDLVYSTAMVVKNGKRKIVQLSDLEIALETMGIQVAKWKEMKIEYQKNPRPAAAQAVTQDEESESEGEDAAGDAEAKSTVTSKTTSTRHTRTGTMARREVKRLSMNNKMLIRHARFKRCVNEMISVLFPEDENVKFSRAAIVLLQVIVESTLCSVLRFALDVTEHCGRKEVSDNDVRFAVDHMTNYYL